MRQFRQAFAIDFRSLRLYRVLLGLVILVDVIYRVPMIDFLYSDNGILPRIVWMHTLSPWLRGSVLAFSGSPYFVGFIFALIAVAAAMLIFDVEVRLSSLIAFSLITSIHNRNWLITYGADNLMRSMLLWSALLPSSRGRLREGAFVNVAAVGALIELAVLYICAGWFKSSELWLWHPTATYLALNMQFFARGSGSWLLGYPALLAPLTVYTFLLERFAWVFFFFPWKTGAFRIGAFVAFAGMHAGIAWTMDVHMFPLTDIAFLTLLLPPSFWNFILERGTHSRDFVVEKLVIWKDGFWVTGLSAALLIILTSLNVRDLAAEYFHLSWVQRNAERPFGFSQNWRLFAPHPPLVSGWFAAVGTKMGGQRVDAINLIESPPDFSPPLATRDRLPSRKWVEALMNLTFPSQQAYRPSLGHYLCRRWRENKNEKLRSVDVYYMMRQTPPPGQRSEHQVSRFASVSCQSD